MQGTNVYFVVYNQMQKKKMNERKFQQRKNQKKEKEKEREEQILILCAYIGISNEFRISLKKETEIQQGQEERKNKEP